MFTRIVDHHPKAVALASASCITATIVLSLSTMFLNVAEASDAGHSNKNDRKTQVATAPAGDASVDRGRYLAQISGCNDCHTAGYAESGGKVPTSEWLTGVPVGFKGPWGISYPANLRLTVQSLTEQQWLVYARAERLPPMPWFALRDMNDDDLRSMYRFMRSLGPKGERTPPATAPGAPATTPFILFQPQVERVTAAR